MFCTSCDNDDKQMANINRVKQLRKHEILRDEKQMLPVFALRSAKSHIATPVVSLPVPAVVGTTSTPHLSIR